MFQCIQARAFTTATHEPHQRLNIDTIGPLPPGADGSCYILVLIDTFTRWIELYVIILYMGEKFISVIIITLNRTVFFNSNIGI